MLMRCICFWKVISLYFLPNGSQLVPSSLPLITTQTREQYSSEGWIWEWYTVNRWENPRALERKRSFWRTCSAMEWMRDCQVRSGVRGRPLLITKLASGEASSHEALWIWWSDSTASSSIRTEWIVYISISLKWNLTFEAPLSYQLNRASLITDDTTLFLKCAASLSS